MRFKTWPVAALGLGSLLILIFVSMIASSRKAEGIYTELDRLNTYHYEVDAKLGGCAPTSTCRASSSATTCSTSNANARPSIASS